ncbi:hypothetical protein HRED_06462 [Candidatus Haloredivivus sp. G17]|nr:hypothetical protein HRED_06462 [Candidatus Haloredivivus sp. G17]
MIKDPVYEQIINQQLLYARNTLRDQQAEKIIEEKTTIFFEASALNNFTEYRKEKPSGKREGSSRRI